MSVVNQIALSLDILAQNIARLQEQAATMPTAREIVTTRGADGEKAQADYIEALRVVAGEVARKTQLVRLYVEHNAEALQKASHALLETDGNTSLEARQTAAFIQSAAEAAQQPAQISSGSSEAKRRAW